MQFKRREEGDHLIILYQSAQQVVKIRVAYTFVVEVNAPIRDLQ